MIEDWMNWIEKLSCQEGNAIIGVQKMIQGQRWVVPYDSFKKPGWDMTTFGYSERGNKMKALEKNYYDRERFKQAIFHIKKIVKKKQYGSTQFPLTGEVKLGKKQTFCMSACSITNWPKEGIRVCIFYRTTEVTKKFGADLVFFKDIILPKINQVREIKDITFMFSNLTVHPMFFSTLFCHLEDPMDFLDKVRKSDPRFYTYIERWLCKYLYYGETGFVQKFSQAKQTLKAFERMVDPERKELLYDFFQDAKERHA